LIHSRIIKFDEFVKNRIHQVLGFKLMICNSTQVVRFTVQGFPLEAGCAAKQMPLGCIKCEVIFERALSIDDCNIQ